MTDLEQLSREAAKVLTGADLPIQWNIGPDGERTGALYNYRDMWLHESTEACAEIAWRSDFYIRYVGGAVPSMTAIRDSGRDEGGALATVWLNEVPNRDRVVAARICTLLALIEVKK